MLFLGTPVFFSEAKQCTAKLRVFVWSIGHDESGVWEPNLGGLDHFLFRAEQDWDAIFRHPSFFS